MSLNWSNPLLRWGHTSQPITMGLESGTLPEPINTFVGLFFSSSPTHSFPAPFHSFWNTISWVTTSPQRRKWFVCASLSVFFSPKALVLISLELVCHAIVCNSFIHKIHNTRGEIPQPPRLFCSWLCLCLHWTGLYPRSWSPLILSSLEGM